MSFEKDSLFSRQIGTIGKKSMEQLLSQKVLLIGNNNVAIEFSKCVSMLGVETLFIVKIVSKKARKSKLDPIINDIKYYNDIKERESINRVSIITDLCSKLNKSLNIKVVSESILDNLSNFITTNKINIVVYAELLPKRSIQCIEEEVLKTQSKFILGFNHGLNGYIFSNFGNHTIHDSDGEIVKTAYLEHFTKTEDVIDIRIEKLDGMITSDKGYISNKNGESIDVNCLGNSLDSVQIKFSTAIWNFLKQNKDNNMKFVEKKVSIHKIYNLYDHVKNKDSTQIINLITSFDVNSKSLAEKNKYLDNIEKAIYKHDYMKNLEFLGEFPILGSIIGGILAHEVIKLTGKYLPLDQDIFFDFRELNPSLTGDIDKKNTSVLEKSTIDALSKLNIFMIGCGALGCEISKNLGTIGACTKNNSILTITDMDTIELSNLNRQFLFRQEDIGSSKSSAVKERLNSYFPKMKINSLTNEVGVTTENIFNTAFWRNNDLIISALDNIEARQYVDSRCVKYEKPLFESGTLGCKCNTQTIIPHKTATYSEINDVEDKSIPMCTVRNFPNCIEHCVEWGIETFRRIIEEGLGDLNRFYNQKNSFWKSIHQIDNNLIMYERCQITLLFDDFLKNKSFNTYLKFANEIYNNLYVYPIMDILKSFPESLKDEFDNPFWGGKKLKPTIIKFTSGNKTIETFCINLLIVLNKHIKGLGIDWNESSWMSYTPLDNHTYREKTIEVNIEKDETNIELSVNEVEKIISILKNTSDKKRYKIMPIEYDKDVDYMLHLMSPVCNLRAEIYNINSASILDIKMISGRIVPALSTTTTVIAGLVTLEILKKLKGFKPSDSNINLATNTYVLFDSEKPKVTYNNMLSPIYGMKIKTIPEHFNTWSRWNINIRKDSCNNLKELLSIISSDYKVKPCNIIVNNKHIIYNGTNDNLDKPLIKVFDEVGKHTTDILDLELVTFDEYGLPILTPRVLLSY